MMDLKEKNILKETFDSMNMSGERSAEIMEELVNYNMKKESKEGNEMRKENVINKENDTIKLHEISPKNSNRGRFKWAPACVSVAAVAAIAAMGIFIWQGRQGDENANKYSTGAGSLVGEADSNEAAKNEIGEIGNIKENDVEDLSNKEDGSVVVPNTIYYTLKGETEVLSAPVVASVYSDSFLYEIKQGDISILVKSGYNYNIYKKETEDGLKVMAVGICREGDTYHYVYTEQLSYTQEGETFGADNEPVYNGVEAAASGESSSFEGYGTPEFVKVSFAADEKYEENREEKIQELAAFYNDVNNFIGYREPEMSYKQVGIEGESTNGMQESNIEGELPEGSFEYAVIQEMEENKIGCGMIDPVEMKLELYFAEMDGGNE